MKLSRDTFLILKNFSEIDKSIIIEKGNVLETRSPGVLARALVEETFLRKMCIYDLPQFLSVLSLFDDPDLIVGDKSVEIVDGNNSVSYRYADPSLIKMYDKLADPEITHTVKISALELQNLTKAARVIGAEHIFVETDGEKVKVIARNKQGLSHKFEIELGACDFRPYTFVLPVSRFVMMGSDYSIGFGKIQAVNFSTPRLSYWLAMDATNA